MDNSLNEPAQATDTLDLAPAPPTNIWSRGNYAVIGSKLSIISENLCENIDLTGGSRVLDVATGHGNTAIAAGKRDARVSALDNAAPLLELGRQRAAQEGCSVEFTSGDAARLPYEDAGFDYVLSSFGVQFAPQAQQVAAELVRVCKPGGLIGLTNWVAQGFTSAFAQIIARYGPKSPMPSPYLWGDLEYQEALFGDQVIFQSYRSHTFYYRFASAQAWLDCFITHYGPVMALYQSLEEKPARQFYGEVIDLVEQYNQAEGSGLLLPIEYRESHIEKK